MESPKTVAFNASAMPSAIWRVSDPPPPELKPRCEKTCTKPEPAQNQDRDRHNRTDQQRPHEKAAPREKSENDIHDSRRFGNDPGDDHPLGKIMNPRSSISKPSDGNDCATSSGIGGRCASS